MADYNTITDVSVKYLKDENGNVISPVTSSKSVFLPNNNKMLQDKIDNIDDSILTINDKLINATTSTAGFMSAEDKTKLDGITENADSVSVTQTLTSGTKVGTVTVNGTDTDLYAPNPGITRYFSTVAKSIQSLNNNQWMSGKGSYRWAWPAPSGYTGTGMVTWRCTGGAWRVDGAYWENGYLNCDIYVNGKDQPCDRGGITFYVLFYK